MPIYAVKWREEGGLTFVGRLDLTSHTLRLVGRRTGHPGAVVRREVPYELLLQVGQARGRRHRLEGRPALVLESVAGERYVVADIGLGVPILQEVADRLSSLAVESRPPSRVEPRS